MNCKIVTSYSVKYIEFPELLFASDTKGNLYFDATLYIEQKGDINCHSPADFARKFAFWIESAKRAYDVEYMVVTDDAIGHTLFDESMALLFVCYIDPPFSIYILERMSEMLINGLVLSDSYISQVASERLNFNN
ncbi:MAG: hypothetical protein SNJ29_08840 [Rikenellaceae bacterium]